MPRKAMKCIVEVDIHVVTCPGTFLRDYEYVYMHMEMLGLEARTKSVPPTFPLFYHERLKFERTFSDCTDPGLVASVLKGEDIILELRQHTDYVSDGKVIAHCSSNTHDFLYPAIPPYYGSGREILLYKTSKFKPIRVTGEPVKLEFSTKTIIKEIPDYDSPEGRVTSASINNSTSTLEASLLKSHNKKSSLNASNKSKSTPDLTKEGNNDDFVIRRKDDNLLSNRDFSTYVSPKPRRSLSPVRSSSTIARRSASPTRSKVLGNTTVEPIPAWRYSTALNSTPSARHLRSRTDPLHNATLISLQRTLDDLELNESRRLRNRYRTYTSPHVLKALNSSQRIAKRVDDLLYKKELIDSDLESDLGLDLLRESLREERNTLNDAIKEADREAFYRSLNRTR